MREKHPRRRITHENRVTWLTMGAVAPAAIVAFSILWFGDYTPKVQWTLTLVIVGLFCRLCGQRARAHGSSAADDDESAGGAA